jgi:hypothetical protein
MYFVTVLSNKFMHCKLPEEIRYQVDQSKIIDVYDCVNYGGSWENKNLNFDNLFESYLSLFVMVTGEGWIQVMHDAVDSTDLGMQP